MPYLTAQRPSPCPIGHRFALHLSSGANQSIDCPELIQTPKCDGVEDSMQSGQSSAHHTPTCKLSFREAGMPTTTHNSPFKEHMPAAQQQPFPTAHTLSRRPRHNPYAPPPPEKKGNNIHTIPMPVPPSCCHSVKPTRIHSQAMQHPVLTITKARSPSFTYNPHHINHCPLSIAYNLFSIVHSAHCML